jgi:hypothetical protein
MTLRNADAVVSVAAAASIRSAAKEHRAGIDGEARLPESTCDETKLGSKNAIKRIVIEHLPARGLVTPD